MLWLSGFDVKVDDAQAATVTFPVWETELGH